MAQAPDVIPREPIVQRAVDFVFGYDFFISYSHDDGRNYPRRLKERLEQAGFKVFLDQTEYVAGADLRRETRRQVEKSRKIIVVGRPAALRSEWVEREVEVAVSGGKTPVLININSAVESASADARVAMMARERHWLRFNEVLTEADGDPTDQAVTELIRSFQYTRQETKRLRAFAAAAAVLVIIASVAVWQAVEAIWARNLAVQNEQLAIANMNEAARQRDQAQIAQSRFLADLATRSTNSGENPVGMLLALAALPDERSGRIRPPVPEAQKALFDAYRSLREIAVTRGDESGLGSATFSPEGRQIATVSGNGLAAIWDAEAPRKLAVLAHKDADSVDSAAFSPDGRRVVTAGKDGTRVWEAENGKEVGFTKGYLRRVSSATFSPDGRWVVTGSQRDGIRWKDSLARIWEIGTRKEIMVLSGHEDGIASAEFTPDGKYVVTASDDGTVRTWDVETGQQLHVLLHKKGPTAATLSPDGRRIATRSLGRLSDAPDAKDFSIVHLWDAATGTRIATLRGHDSAIWIHDVAFSRDGRRLVTAAGFPLITPDNSALDNTARIWETETGRQVVLLKGHQDSVHGAVFTPDGRYVVTASRDRTARLWDADEGNEVAVFRGHAGDVTSAEFDPSGRRILTASRDGTMRLWRVEDCHGCVVLSGHPAHVASAAFSADGRRVVTASSDKTARIWDSETGTELNRLVHDGEVRSAAFGSDHRHVLTVSAEKTVLIWDTESNGQIARLSGHTSLVNSAAFSPDGRRVVTAAGVRRVGSPTDDTARVWDVARAEQIAVVTGHSEPVTSAVFSPDGRGVLTASKDGTVRIWDAQKGDEVAILETGSGEMTSAAFSPDGRRIATAAVDGKARILDATTRKQIARLSGPLWSVSKDAFSPNGRLVVTASGNIFGRKDYTARIWDVETGKEIAVLAGHKSGATSAAFSNDGERVVTASADTTARIWRVFPTTQDLVDHAKKIVPRCLTLTERDQAYLEPEPPAWCIEMKKWPYETGEWGEWLLSVRAGNNPPLPTTK